MSAVNVNVRARARMYKRVWMPDVPGRMYIRVAHAYVSRNHENAAAANAAVYDRRYSPVAFDDRSRVTRRKYCRTHAHTHAGGYAKRAIPTDFLSSPLPESSIVRTSGDNYNALGATTKLYCRLCGNPATFSLSPGENLI